MAVEVFENENYKKFVIAGAVLDNSAIQNAEEETEAENIDTTRRQQDPFYKTGFECLPKMDDENIRKMLGKVGITDIISALIKADEETKESVLRNLTPNLREYVEINIIILEKREVKDYEREKSRTKISEAFSELLYEAHVPKASNNVL